MRKRPVKPVQERGVSCGLDSELSREGRWSADWGASSAGRYRPRRRMLLIGGAGARGGGTSGRVFDGGDYDWLMRVTWDIVGRTRKSGVSYAAVCASVEAAARRLETVSHGAVCPCRWGRGRQGRTSLPDRWLAGADHMVPGSRRRAPVRRQRRPLSFPRPDHRGRASAEYPVGPGPAVC